jgi:hypothetical protein
MVALLATASLAPAGFSSPKLGITNVPIGGERADKLIMEIADDQGVPYPPIEVPVPAADIAKLQAHPSFSGLTDAEVQAKVENIRRAVLCSIDLLKLDDPETAEGLKTLFRAGVICIGLAPDGYNVGAAIWNDGEAEFHLEPVNLYNIPCERLPLWSPDLFELMNSLAHEGLHGRQDVLGWRDAVPLEVAKDRQCKEIEAAQGELDRANAMCAVIDSIAATGQLPDSARGMSRRIGAELLQEFQGDVSGLEEAITAWQQKLEGMKLTVEEVKRFRDDYKRAAELALMNTPEAADILVGLRQHRLFQYYAGENEFAPITRWYINEAPRLVEEEGEAPRLEQNNRMRQLVPPAVEPETFAVPFLDTITTGYVAEEENLALIGGIQFGENGAGDRGVVVGYDLDPTTKRILPETARECFGTTEMAGGYIMNYNAFDGHYYALQLDDNEICRLNDTDDDGFPDEGVLAGYVLSNGISTDNFKLSINYGHIYFTDENTLVATHDYADTVPHFNDPIGLSWRMPGGGDFMGQPITEFSRDLSIRPGFDGCVSIGASEVAIVGSPWGQYRLYDDEMMIAEGCFSAHGRAIPQFDSPLGENSDLWIEDAINACVSVRTAAKPTLSDIPKIEFGGADFDLSVGLKLGYEVNPDFGLKLDYGSSLDGFENEAEVPRPSRFGRSYFSPADFDPSTVNRQFFRVRRVPPPSMILPETLEFTPGLPDYGSVAKNDELPTTARYVVVDPPVFDGFKMVTKDAFKLHDDGTVDMAFASFESQLMFTYRVHYGDTVSEDITATVLPDMNTDLLCDPPIKGYFGDIVLLEALVLEIGGLNYPLYQFSLRPVDPGCNAEHWHSPSYPTVFPIAEEEPVGISDPAIPNCGYGKLSELPVKKFVISKEKWEEFLVDHPKTSS